MRGRFEGESFLLNLLYGKGDTRGKTVGLLPGELAAGERQVVILPPLFYFLVYLYLFLFGLVKIDNFNYKVWIF